MGNMIDKPKIYVIYLQQYSLHVKTLLSKSFKNTPSTRQKGI
jgi:hypothetical protein